MENTRSEKNKKKKSKKWLVILFVVIVIVAVALVGLRMFAPKSAVGAPSVTYAEGTVQRRTIQTTMSSSGTLQPADSYTVTAAVGGDILECSFEEGDVVNKDDIMYVIDSRFLILNFCLSLNH